MILGVDHIALSVSDIDSGIVALKSFGFSERFRDFDVANSVCKRQLQASYLSYHDLAVCDHDCCPSLELTAHGSINSTPGHLGFIPVVPAAESAQNQLPHSSIIVALREPPGVAESLREALGLRVKWMAAPELSIAMWTTSAYETRGSAVCTCCVTDLEASTKFYNDELKAKLGRRGTTAGRPWQIVEFSGPVKRWCLELLLFQAQYGPENSSLMLDSSGFPCIAVLTSDIVADTTRFLNGYGHYPAESFSLSVNGKMLDVAFTRGPSNEIVEFIQVRRNGG